LRNTEDKEGVRSQEVRKKRDSLAKFAKLAKKEKEYI